jgi:hypothetical protein
MLDLQTARRTTLIALALTLAACDPTPTTAPTLSRPGPSVAQPSASQAAFATARPSSPPQSPTPSSPSSTPSPPRSVDVPDELTNVAWAAFDGQGTGLSVGLLGRPASMTRAFSDWTAVIRPAGPYVIVVADGQTEVIDALDGSTFASYPWPKDGEAHHTMASDGSVIYFSRWNDDDEGSLWRMRIDGTGLTRLTDLGTRVRRYEYWRGGFALQPNGSVVASTCAADGNQWTDAAPCRLYVAGPNDDPDQPIRYLRGSTPPVCRLVGATDHHAVFYSTPTAGSCFVDGGLTPVRLVTVALGDRSSSVVPDDYSLSAVGFVELGSDRPWLVAAKDPDPLRADIFWPHRQAVIQSLTNERVWSPGGGGPIFTADWMHWSALRVVGDWVIVEGVGRDFLLCRYGPEVPPEDPAVCGPDTGGLWHPGRDELIPLPIGTYGDPNSFMY